MNATFDRSADAAAWVDSMLDTASEFLGSTPDLVVGRSLSSLAAARVADTDTPSIWNAPLLNRVEVRDGLMALNVPSLLVGGTEDPSWDGEFASQIPHATVAELDGADHSLEIAGDPIGSIDVLRSVAEAVHQFASALA